MAVPPSLTESGSYSLNHRTHSRDEFYGKSECEHCYESKNLYISPFSRLSCELEQSFLVVSRLSQCVPSPMQPREQSILHFAQEPEKKLQLNHSCSSHSPSSEVPIAPTLLDHRLISLSLHKQCPHPIHHLRSSAAYSEMQGQVLGGMAAAGGCCSAWWM